MATVVLQYAGAALGTMVGGPIGGLIGRAVGAMAGNVLDQRLLGQNRHVEGPRLNDLRVMASEEGAAIPAVWGRMRLAGQVIWATNLEEVSNTSTQKQSSKGGGGSGTKTTTYSYFANFAVGLCEGEIDGIGRVWADGKLIDLDAFTTRLYTGTETQSPDSLIESIEGAGAAPAYRGLAYIVFEKLPLERFGNRLPQLSFEVMKRANPAADMVQAVNIIPGSTEFGYDTAIITRSNGAGQTESENAHVSAEKSDWSLSMDQLQATCRNLDAASLVVAWFGNDLRCGSCTLRPKVDNTQKVTSGGTWGVSGLTRASAQQVSQVNGQPAFGGTPSDDTVVRAIQDLKARGLKVVFYPFILMDVPQGNALPDPYGGAAQGAYPWRGRITASVAPGRPGTPDKTAALTAELNSFVGAALPTHFAISGKTVTYSGPAEWSYRRMVLHYAKLCAAAGGVDAFLIGSELRGLTTLRNGPSSFPFVAALQSLAAEVKAILPAAKISYAADWTEYFGHQPQDGTGDVYFHLDPLWASPAVDFVGIDNYMPLTDWRDGTSHLDAALSAGGIYDLEYLKSRIAGGEGFDWFYASQAARDAQVRSSITDGAYGKPWVFRYKDVKSWWSNAHYNRPGGVQQPSATAWVPQGKPIWFTETGCPAIDKGTNGPNAFYDAKSAESLLPPYSGGQQDDLIQNRFIQAMQAYWGTAGAHNPVSSVYGGPMVEASRLFYWAWDARPFPGFPVRTDIWSDGANVSRGHWLNGRLAAVDLASLVGTLAERFGIAASDASTLAGLVDGFVLDRPMTGRDALEDLLQAFCVDAVEADGVMAFRPRNAPAPQEVDAGLLVDAAPGKPVLQQTRLQEADLPQTLRIGYSESGLDYRTAAVAQSRSGTASSRAVTLSLPAAVSQSLAQARADVALAEAWAARTHAEFSLAPSALALEPGDVLAINGAEWRITTVMDGEARKVSAVSHDAAAYDPPPAEGRLSASAGQPVFGQPDVLLLDLALNRGSQPAAPWVAVQQSPWPGGVAVLRQSGPASYAPISVVEAQATLGTLLTSLPAGRLWRVDGGASFDVKMDHGALNSISRAQLLAGENAIAVGDMASGFELLQFETATLIAPNCYRISGLLRGQGGSAAEMLPLRPAGQRLVLLNGAVQLLPVSLAEAALASTWRAGPRVYDHGHPSYRSLSLPPTMKALRPLAPVQARARRVAGGIALSWLRQTRSGGDSWELAEVPLAEDLESYRADILDGATVKRSLSLSAPGFTYSDSQMITDFGSLQSSIRLRVAQVSASFGAGTPLERILYV